MDISKVEEIENGGFLCEINERFDEMFNFRTTHGINAQSDGKTGVAISLKDPDEVTEDIQKRVQQIVQDAEDALYSESFKDLTEGYSKYFDVDALIDWYILHELVCMYDASSFFTSVYFYYDPADEKIHMGPCWDYDTGMRREVVGLECKKSNSWYLRLFEDDGFSRLVCMRWREIYTKLQESGKWIEAHAKVIETSAQMNFSRWAVLGTPYNGIKGWEDLKTYPEQVSFLTNWINQRITALDNDYLLNNNKTNSNTGTL